MRSKIKQFLIYVLQILIFALLSAVLIYLVIKSDNYQLMALYVYPAIAFLFWLPGIIFKLKLCRLLYKVIEKLPDPEPPSLAGVMGASKLSYEDAAKRFPKVVRGLLYSSYITLVLGIVIVFSVCLYTHAF